MKRRTVGARSRESQGASAGVGILSDIKEGMLLPFATPLARVLVAVVEAAEVEAEVEAEGSSAAEVAGGDTCFSGTEEDAGVVRRPGIWAERIFSRSCSCALAVSWL